MKLFIGEDNMIQITTTELKSNLRKYIDHAEHEDIIVTRNGKKVAKLVSQKQDKIAIAKSLFGAIPNTFNADSALDERRKNI
jgi:prevent-host-death family protein